MAASNSELVMVRYEKIKHINVCINDITIGCPHEHSALEFGIVLDGTVRVLCHSGEYIVKPGGLLLFNSYEPHEVRTVSATPARVLYVQLSGAFGKEYYTRISNIEFDNSVLAELPPQTLASIRQALLDTAEAFFSEPEAFGLECAGKMCLMLATVLREVPHKLNTDSDYLVKKKKISRTQRIASYIDQHYKEKLTLSELAKVEGITTAYMSRIFSELFHMPFQEYLSQLRLQKALPLLKNPNIYLVDICMECGFSDTRYLNAVCQKEFGCNAATYRKQLLSKNGAAPGDGLAEGITEPKYNDKASLKLLQGFAARC